MDWKDVSVILKGSFSRFSERVRLLSISTEVLKEVLGVLVEEKQLRIKGKRLYVSGHPALKNEIQLKKDILCNTLHERTGGFIDDVC